MGSESGTPDPGVDELDIPQEPAMRVPMPPPGHAYMRDRMEEEGFTFEFFQAVRLLERLAPDRRVVVYKAISAGSSMLIGRIGQRLFGVSGCTFRTCVCVSCCGVAVLSVRWQPGMPNSQNTSLGESLTA